MGDEGAASSVVPPQQAWPDVGDADEDDPRRIEADPDGARPGAGPPSQDRARAASDDGPAPHALGALPVLLQRGCARSRRQAGRAGVCADHLVFDFEASDMVDPSQFQSQWPDLRHTGLDRRRPQADRS